MDAPSAPSLSEVNDYSDYGLPVPQPVASFVDDRMHHAMPAAFSEPRLGFDDKSPSGGKQLSPRHQHSNVHAPRSPRNNARPRSPRSPRDPSSLHDPHGQHQAQQSPRRRPQSGAAEPAIRSGVEATVSSSIVEPADGSKHFNARISASVCFGACGEMLTFS